MPDEKSPCVVLLPELRKICPRVKAVTYLGDFINVSFKKLPFGSPDKLVQQFIDLFYRVLSDEFSFMRQKDNIWVFSKSVNGRSKNVPRQESG